jgi:hypothetical protein
VRNLVLCSAFLFLPSAFRVCAQSVLAPPPPEFSRQGQTFRSAGTNLLEVGQPQTTNAVATNEVLNPTPAPSTAPARGLLDWGPIHLHPHPFYRITYGNGIQSSPGNPTKTLINELSPGIGIDIGTHWHLDYTPTLRFYSSSSFRDTVDQSVNFAGGLAYENWVFGLSQGYSSSSDPLAETGAQTDQETYHTALKASCLLNSYLSLDLGFNQDFRFVSQNVSTQQVLQLQQLSDSQTWTVNGGLNYQFSPGLHAGFNIVVGYDSVQIGSDMSHEQFQLNLNWHPGQKLTFFISGGFEDRQFLDSRAPDTINPIFNGTLRYQLFEATGFSLAASHTIAPSYYNNQITEATDFSGAVRQRFFGHLFLDLTGGYRTTSYQTTTATQRVHRRDDFAFFDIRITCPFLKNGTVSVFYDTSENSSSQSGFAYASEQVGLEVGYRF